MSVLDVYIGAHESGYSDDAVAVVKGTILANTITDIKFTELSDGGPGTGFSTVRWNIPQTEGYAIYLDSDVIVYGDIADLLDYALPGMYVGGWSVNKKTGARCRGTMPAVIDCAAQGTQSLREHVEAGIHSTYRCMIPKEWNNCGEYIEGETLMLHLTEQSKQPWNPLAAKDRGVDRIWLDMRDRYVI